MPKVSTNPKSRNQIQYDSDEKRGVKVKGFKLHIDDIAFIKAAAERLNIPQNELIVRAVRAYCQD